MLPTRQFYTSAESSIRLCLFNEKWDLSSCTIWKGLHIFDVRAIVRLRYTRWYLCRHGTIMLVFLTERMVLVLRSKFSNIWMTPVPSRKSTIVFIRPWCAGCSNRRPTTTSSPEQVAHEHWHEQLHVAPNLYQRILQQTQRTTHTCYFILKQGSFMLCAVVWSWCSCRTEHVYTMDSFR